jgi:hypothetical protein
MEARLAHLSRLCLFVAWIQQGGDNLNARRWFSIGLVFDVTGLAGHARRGA